QGKIRNLIGRGVTADIAISSSVPEDDEPENVQGTVQEHVDGESYIMNAELDEDTGEMVAVDVLNASKVVARFNNVSERLGQVSISFDIMVPSSLLSSDLQLRFSPVMHIGSEYRTLDILNVTGAGYRGRQLRGYQRYRDFLASIVTDTTDLIMMRQLEMFIRRYFPRTYAMKRDSSVIPEPSAANLFGVTQKEALVHYSMTLKRRVNDWKKHNREKMYRKYVREPMETGNVRLDTVIESGNGDLTYRYVQTFRTMPGLRKVTVGMNGTIRRYGEKVCDFPSPDSLTYYISSLSTLADCSTRYRTVVTERVVRDRMRAKIGFGAGKSTVDMDLGDNAAEMMKVKSCVQAVFENDEMVLDSLVVSAGCSPEGSVALNDRLSMSRSVAVRDCLAGMYGCGVDSLIRVSLLSENWQLLDLLVQTDSTLSESDRRIYADAAAERNQDRREYGLKKMPGYRYVREFLYPRLRHVVFDFYMHRRGMVKDTLHTTEVDTCYMRGLECLRNLDYSAAVEILRPYGDYNAALAFASAGYDFTSWSILENLPDEKASVCYLKSLVLARMGRLDEARDYLRTAMEKEPSMRFRANLDPEMDGLVKNK
ncbi:MAG: hypothetical protein ACI39U_02560, partial [Candidatus Cryptobacteroides sp.]